MGDVTLRLTLDPDHCEMDALIGLEEISQRPRSEVKLSELRTCVAMFVADEDGQALPLELALQRMKHLTVSQYWEVFDQLGDSLKRIMERALPPGQSSSSS